MLSSSCNFLCSITSPQASKDMFRTLALQITEKFCQGFNASLLAYGQTGSGKVRRALVSWGARTHRHMRTQMCSVLCEAHKSMPGLTNPWEHFQLAGSNIGPRMMMRCC